MGQGINTKAVQCAAFELSKGVCADAHALLPMVHVASPTEFDKFNIADATPTWLSNTSECVVVAVTSACAALNKRLQPYKQKLGPTSSWTQVVAAAAAGGAKLTSSGTKYPLIEGAKYNVYASALCLAEIDVLTGETQILRAEIFYDAGVSLNPAVDIGQVEGSFVQAMGGLLTEEQVFSTTDHRVVNNGTWDYKPPCPLDVPQIFNCHLLPVVNAAKGAVLGSKATGEPAYLLGAAAFFAVKAAIYAARLEVNESAYFNMAAPATPAVVQSHCLVVLPPPSPPPRLLPRAVAEVATAAHPDLNEERRGAALRDRVGLRHLLYANSTAALVSDGRTELNLPNGCPNSEQKGCPKDGSAGGSLVSAKDDAPLVRAFRAALVMLAVCAAMVYLAAAERLHIFPYDLGRGS